MEDYAKTPPGCKNSSPTPTNPRVPVFFGARVQGWPNKESTAKKWKYLPLSEVLSKDFPSDAHFCPYSVPRFPYRLTSEAPGRVGGVPLVAACFDVDCPKEEKGPDGKADGPGWVLYELPKIADLLRENPGGFVYFTRGGYRVVYRLPEPFVIHTREDSEEWTRRYLGWLASLARRYEITADVKCGEWQRLYRAPHATREKGQGPERWEVIGNPRALGVWEYTPSPEEIEEDRETARALGERSPAWRSALKRILPTWHPGPSGKGARTYYQVDTREFSDSEVGELVSALAPPMAPLSQRGGVFRFLVGSLLRRGFPGEKLEPLFSALSRALGEEEEKTQERVELGSVKLGEFQQGVEIAGLGELKEGFPEVYQALGRVLPPLKGAKRARAEADSRGSWEEVSPEEAREKIALALREARNGLTVLRVTEGTGKSYQAAGVAGERAQAGLKTLIVVPSHQVGRASYVEPLTGLGVPVFHKQSVLAVRAGDGSPACVFHERLSQLAAGGHSPVPLACLGIGRGPRGKPSPCPHKDDCGAFKAQGSPPQEALVVVSVREYLPSLLPWVGEEGLVIVDENPGAVEALTLSPEALSEALDCDDSYLRGEGWRFPVIRALKVGLEALSSPEKSPAEAPLLALLRRGIEALGEEEDWKESALRWYGSLSPEEILQRFAFDCAFRKSEKTGEWKRRGEWAPWLSGSCTRKLRGGMLSPEEAALLSRGGKAHADIAQAAAALHCPEAGERALVSLEESEEGASLLRVVRWALGVGEAFTRPGPSVLLDATAEPLLVKALSPHARFLDIRVKDGAPISRVLLSLSHASRKHLLLPDSSGRRSLVNWQVAGPYLKSALEEALSRVELGDKAPRVSVVSWQPLYRELSQAWEHGGYPEVQEALSPLRERGGELVLPPGGYFGNLRSRNDWLEKGGVDALITLGDSRPNLGAVRAIAGALSLSSELDAITEHLTAGELSQAHGRYRAPHRARPLAAVHVGKFLPASWDSRAEVKELPQGRPQAHTEEEKARAVKEASSLREAARALGLSWGGAKTAEALKKYQIAPSPDNYREAGVSEENPGFMGVGENSPYASTFLDSLFSPTPMFSGFPNDSEDLGQLSCEGANREEEESGVTHPRALLLSPEGIERFTGEAVRFELEEGLSWEVAQESAWEALYPTPTAGEGAHELYELENGWVYDKTADLYESLDFPEVCVPLPSPASPLWGGPGGSGPGPGASPPPGGGQREELQSLAERLFPEEKGGLADWIEGLLHGATPDDFLFLHGATPDDLNPPGWEEEQELTCRELYPWQNPEPFQEEQEEAMRLYHLGG